METRVALVTGGSRGIGRAIAQKLASGGAKVAIVYRTHTNEANRVVEEIVADGGEALALPADVRSWQAVQGVVAQIEGTWGAVNILINNAGIARDGLLVRMSEEDWHDVIETHLTGMFHCTRAVLRKMMRQKWGRIVNISSVAGLAGNAGQTNYATAKAGIIGFTRALAKEVGGRGITVNAIAPGFIATDMTRDLDDEWKRQILALTPTGRFGLPQEVASMAAFLASEDAEYITGQVISVDGGLGMR
jgi:3-oxoacyl-[acyl-carrier protein] reductase